MDHIYFGRNREQRVHDLIKHDKRKQARDAIQQKLIDLEVFTKELKELGLEKEKPLDMSLDREQVRECRDSGQKLEKPNPQTTLHNGYFETKYGSYGPSSQAAKGSLSALGGGH
ncbi:predicted protein [Uncinocarpus reesii 1704]|uniref:Uncharacterized protein n=1 Tax=Uncinocarpus reesii (strain UAMH 1704) TaxID=336963 RepID=C4JTT2_UNCRE|nr:uncharacterized protein UREG_05871 [Uncinocarpus reesii 1704]EEP81029.1 predicted protein [Uncinocarpus reesii 1704]